MTSSLRSLALAAGFLAVALVPCVAALPLLRVSDDGRLLVTAEGRPFFWLGDTAWELFHRLDKEETAHYLRTRAEQGFNVVQAVALAELEGLTVPNREGHLPLLDQDPTRPNEAYFEHVDWVLAEADKLGLYMGLLPTWGDKWNRKWGVGPVVFTPQNAATYGELLGRRYAGRNVIWIVGGDRPVENDEHRAIVEAMARGLRRGDGGKGLITFHPSGGQGSSEYFHEADWLDFNMRQNGHEVNFAPRYAKTRADYNRTPIKPVLDGEPAYEDHPIAFKAAEFGHTTASDVRRLFYWDVFQGAFGHTYGHHSVWQMFAPERKPVNAPLMSWSDALRQPGAAQMQHGRWLMESRPLAGRIPADDVIVPEEIATAVPGEGRYRFVATRAADGGHAMVYVPVERRFRVRLDVISGGRVRAWWYNPRNGEASPAGEWPATGERAFTPPSLGEGLDWVLVLDDAARDYPAPGTRR
jgi:hypothetical protein